MGSLTLLLFWRSEPPTDIRYYAVQRECMNAALLQALEGALQTAKEPIVIKENPVTKFDAVENLYAFSTEGRDRFRGEEGTLS